MIEKIKLSSWDFFVSMLFGYALLLNVLVHCVLKGAITLNMIFGFSTALLAVAGLLTIMLAGLLFEPLANCIYKLKTWPWNYPKQFSFKEWDSNIKFLEEKAQPDVPTGTTDIYQYCKNYVQQHGLADLYMPFLAKYGFYRNISVLLLLNLIVIPFFYSWTLLCMCTVLLSILVMLLICLYRSGVFYRHMSVTVFFQFIILSEKKECKVN